MPFVRPPLTELRSRVRNDFNARLPGADSRLRQSNIRVSADVMAGLAHLVYGALDYLAKQVIPDTAEAQYLERWCNIFGVVRKGAERATGSIRFAGTDGAEIPIGTIAQTGNRGASYRTTAIGVIAGGQAVIAAESIDPGELGNNDAAVKVNLVSALPGIVATAELASEMVGGADDEPDEDLRTRLLLELQKPPAGGNQTDYERWALEVPGVTRAWCSGNEFGPGTVVVRFMMDRVRLEQQGIPTGDSYPNYTDDLKLVADHIAPRRPVTASVFVVAPIPRPIDIVVKALTPDRPEVRAAVEAELRDLFLRSAQPGLTIPRSWLWAAVSTVSGEYSHEIIDPAEDVIISTAEIATLGDLSFVE
ncbi:baseplate J/gp47 family protein [Dongia soli]|uniref:Baseplate J/gp47 family protein n=1 Tax=Dongia soli TaxID=600628 RepID=A0ABU5E8G4_9PROT|nr:baseplate J/gp47 family protein [Dongia soli]MDY0882315.1 baseplate J/gp47 family protein [Dongia soli]